MLSIVPINASFWKKNKGYGLPNSGTEKYFGPVKRNLTSISLPHK